MELIRTAHFDDVGVCFDIGHAHIMNTVAGNEMLVLEQRRKTPTVLFFGLNPGLVKTRIRSNFMGEGSLKPGSQFLQFGQVWFNFISRSKRGFRRLRRCHCCKSGFRILLVKAASGS